jgi:hypothetical protein
LYQQFYWTLPLNASLAKLVGLSRGAAFTLERAGALSHPAGVLERKRGTTSAKLCDLDPLINEAMEEWQIPGPALAVVFDGEPALSNAEDELRVDSH